MGFSQQRIPQQLRANEAVGDAVAAVGHGKMYTWPVRFMWAEKRHAITGFGKGSSPRKCDFKI